MELTTAVKLIESGVHKSGNQQWADLGAGHGLFTRALASLLGAGSVIHAVDRDASALRTIELPGHVALQIHHRQLEEPLGFNQLDGILMANALHFIEDKKMLLHQLSGYLKPGGGVLLVEYDTDEANPWVPYPISYASLEQLAALGPNKNVRKLHSAPSRYQRSGMYAALITG